MERRLHRRVNKHRRMNRRGNCRWSRVHPIVRAIQWFGAIISDSETATMGSCSGRVFFAAAFFIFNGQGCRCLGRQRWMRLDTVAEVLQPPLEVLHRILPSFIDLVTH